MPYPTPTAGYARPTAPASAYPQPTLTPPGGSALTPPTTLPPLTVPGYATQTMQSSQLAMVESALGTTLGSDPNQWTPETAAEQTNVAIAKLATVNPKLAEELLAKQQGQETDEGFWGNLKDLAGDIVAPVLSIGAKALEILSRPSHVIPAMLANDDDPWWEDIGQALSGSDKTTWANILEQWGVDNSWVRGIAGFVGDVATDPLTYLTFGTTGVGRAAATRAASKTVGISVGKEALQEAADRGLVELVGGTVDNHLASIFDDMLRAKKFTPGSESADAIAAIARAQVSDAEQVAVTRMLEAADYTHRMAATVGLRKMPEQVALSVGRPLTKTEVYGILDNGRRALNFGAKPSWLQAKALAGAEGGVRFRAAVPFTSLRYISPAVPFTANVVPFQLARHFATGTAGMGKILSQVEATGGDVSKVMDTWVDGGYKGVMEKFPELAPLRARGASFGSWFYSKSQTIGGITAQLSPHAQAMRGGGLFGQMAADFNVLARQWKNDLINTGWTWRGPDGVEHGIREIHRQAAAALKPEKYDLYTRYRDLIPSRAADDDLEGWFDDMVFTPLAQAKERGLINAEHFDDRMANAQARLEELQAMRTELSDAERDVLHKFREMQDSIRGERTRAGATIGDTSADWETAKVLRPKDADEWQQFSYAGLRGVDLYVYDDVGDLAARRAERGFDVTDLSGGGVTGISRNGEQFLDEIGPDGVAISRDPELGTRVRVKLERPAIVDNRTVAEKGPGATALDNGAHIDELRADARQAAEKELAAQRAKLDKAPERVGTKAPRTAIEKQAEALDLLDVETRTNELVAAALQKEGFDGLVVYDADGVIRATAFDPDRVRTIDDLSPAVVRDKGYTPRTISDEAMEWLKGNASPDDRRVIYGAPKLVHDMERFDPSLTLAEAEEELRLTLRRKGYNVPDDLRLYERNPLRIHDKYVSRMATDTLHEWAGFNARRMEVAAGRAPGMLGGPAGSSVYKFKVSDLPDKVVDKLPSAVNRAMFVAERANRRYLAAQYKESQRAAERMAELRAAVLDELDPSTSLAGRTQKALRVTRVDSQRLGAQLDKELLGKLKELSDIKKAAKVAQGDDVATLAARESDVINDINDLRKRIKSAQREAAEAPKPLVIGQDYVDELADVTERTGGATFDPVTGRFLVVGKDKGWSVATETGTSMKVPAEAWAEPTLRDAAIKKFLRENPQLREERLYLGTWKDDAGDVHVDVSEVFTSRDEAVRAGIDRGQEAIFDLKRGEEILTTPMTFEAFKANHAVVQVPIDWLLRRVKDAGLRRRGNLSELSRQRVDEAKEFLAREGWDPEQAATVSIPKGYNYQGGYPTLVDGTHRLLAARELGMDTVPVQLTGELDYSNLYKWYTRNFAQLSGARPPKNILSEAEVHGKAFNAILHEVNPAVKALYSPSDTWKSLGLTTERAKLEFLQEKADAIADAVGMPRQQLQQEAAVLRGAHELAHYDFADEVIRFDKSYLKSRPGPVIESLGHEMAHALHQIRAQGVAAKGAKVAKSEQVAATVGRDLDTLADRLGHLTERIGREEAEGAARIERLSSRLAEAIDEQNRVVAKYRMDSARPLVALEENIAGKTGFKQLQVKGLEHLAMPAYVADEFHHALEGLPGLTGLHKEWRKFNSVWKEWATFRYPGFHVRNAMGAWFNNFLGGVTVEDYRMAIRIRKALSEKGADALVDAKLVKDYQLERVFRTKDITWGDLATRVADNGIGAANARATADVRSVAEAVSKELGSSGKVSALRRFGESPKAKWVPFTRSFGESTTELTENFFRTAAFMGGMRATGGDEFGARAFTMLRHGDYTDLTDFEERFVKDVLPFYKWLRTNFPYQLRTLVENPGKHLAALKAKDAAYVVQGFDPEEARAGMPDWMRNEFALPFPKGGDIASFVMLDLPMSDLNLGAREFFSSFIPFARPVIESFIAEKNLFTGAPLEGKMVPLAGVFQLPVIRDVLLALHVGEENTDGQVMVDDRLQNLLSAIPVFSRFRNWMYADPERAGLRAGTLFSTVAGIGVRPSDEQSMTNAELSFYYDEVEPAVAQLRDLGYVFPDKDKLDPSIFTLLGMDPPQAAA